MRAAAAFGAVLALLGLAACDRASHTGASSTPEASTQVIGVQPAEPSKSEPPGVTPVDGPQSDSRKKAVESTSMPLEGQPNSHSSLSPQASQKSEPAQSTEGSGQSGVK